MREDEDLSANGAIGGDFFGDLAPYVDDALDTSDHHYHQRPPRHHHHQMTAGAALGTFSVSRSALDTEAKPRPV